MTTKPRNPIQTHTKHHTPDQISSIKLCTPSKSPKYLYENHSNNVTAETLTLTHYIPPDFSKSKNPVNPTVNQLSQVFTRDPNRRSHVSSRLFTLFRPCRPSRYAPQKPAVHPALSNFPRPHPHHVQAPDQQCVTTYK